MSDTSAPSAPPSAPNPTPQTQTEVPVNPSPPNSPTPVGPQAPQAPVGDVEGSKHRPLSRREAIQAAFDRATKQQDAAQARARAPKPEPAKAAPADAKPGHNKPPEATEAERPKINLKKRPDDQDAKTLDSPQPRDRGRFAPRERTEPDATQAAQTAAQTAAEGTQKPKYAPLHESAPFREPPVRMTDAAKADWAGTPETVRGDIHRVQNEFAKAYQVYKGAHDAFRPVARFHQMAEQHGTTLEQALINYTSMEQKLRADIVGGLDVIVNNLGLKAPNGAKIGLRDIAYHVLSQSPEALKQVQIGNAQQAATSQIGALHQEVRGLKEQLQQMHSAQQFTYTRSQVDQFADSHPRFDELGTLIEAELKLGFDLETAYRRAELLKPATTAAQTRPTAPQTRAPADRSISGSPSASGSGPAPRQRSEKPVGRREAIAGAIRRVNGGL
jgi:hypothetical protein